MDPVVLSLILFVSVFTQSVTGFGSGLVAMAFLASLVDVQVAVPLTTLVSLTVQITVLLRYRDAFRLASILPLAATSVVMVPLAVGLLDIIDRTFLLHLLGLVITGYALYALFNLRLPTIQHPAWALGFGAAAGILTGLFNAGGASLVIYGTCRGWPPSEFRSNLQGIFLINGLTAIMSHLANDNYNATVVNSYLVALPAITLGLLAGFALDRYIDAVRFRKLVLIVLILLGLRYLL